MLASSMPVLPRLALAAFLVLGVASQDAHAKEPAAATPTRAVLLDPVAGSEADARARQALFTYLTKHLKARGFTVARSGTPPVRLRPTLLRVDVVRDRSGVEVKVKTSVTLVFHGLMDAGFERTATVRAGSPKADASRITSSALDAAAGALAQDVAERVAEKK